jgi:membrane fusion protein
VLRASQIRLQQQSLAARVQGMDAELRRADDEIALAQRRLALAQQQAARVDQLLTAGFLSPTQAQLQQQEVIDAETRVQQLQRARLALARDRATLAAESGHLAAQLQTELTQVDRAVAALAQEAAENDARRTQVITAPRDGTVTLLPLAVGQPVLPCRRICLRRAGRWALRRRARRCNCATRRFRIRSSGCSKAPWPA